MTDASDVVRLVRSNGGSLIGKTRLQKSAYFLEEMESGFGFSFSYHHYGPYSDELANVIDDALALKMLAIDWDISNVGTRYAIYRDLGFSLRDEDQNDRRRKILSTLAKYSAVELELAATADFLLKNGYESDPWLETKRRKASKLTEQRVAKAKQLLQELEQFN